MSDILRATSRTNLLGRLRARKQRRYDAQFWELIHRHDWLQYDRPKTAGSPKKGNRRVR